MRGSMIRHKDKLERFVHHNFGDGLTLPMWPLLFYTKRWPEARTRLAEALREWRRRHGRMRDVSDYTLRHTMSRSQE